MERKNVASGSWEGAAAAPGPSQATKSNGGSSSNSSFNRQYHDLLDDIITRLPVTDEESGHSDTEQQTTNHDEKQPLLSSSNSVASMQRTQSDRNNRMGATKYNVNPPNQSPSSHHSFFIYLVTFLSAIGGFLFGYDTGIVSGAMVFIKDYFSLSNIWQEVVVSATILAAWLFSLVAGYLTNSFGRKWVVILASAIFTVGGGMMALAQDKFLLLGGRFTVGAAIGLASMVIPVYIAEVAPVQIRGKLVTINTCFVTFGQFVASVLAGLFSSNPVNGWRWMLGLSAVPSLIQLVCFIFLPESPRWLIQKGRYEEAYESLCKFRSNTSTEQIDIEFDSIKDSFLASQREEESPSLGRILQNPSIRRALFVGCLLMMFQQLAGINTVMYYSATIIQMSGVHDKSTAVWMSAATASINFIFSFVGILLVERLGRRLLTLSSLLGVVAALLILGVGFQLAENNTPGVTFHPDNQSSVCSLASNCGLCISSSCGFCFFEGHSNINGTCLAINPHNPFQSNDQTFCSNGTSRELVWATNWCPSHYSWMTFAGLMLYLLFFAPGMGPMPWTINSEIYPLYARSFCYSVSTSVNWFFNLLVSITFLTLTTVLTNHGAYYLYAGIAFFGWLLFFVFLPETKGKSLEEIETIFESSLLKLTRKKDLNYAHMENSDSASTATSVQA